MTMVRDSFSLGFHKMTMVKDSFHLGFHKMIMVMDLFPFGVPLCQCTRYFDDIYLRESNIRCSPLVVVLKF